MPVEDPGGRQYWKFAGLGFEFAGVVGLFFYFGHLADQRWDSDPWGLLTGGAIGLIGGIYLLAKEGFRMMDQMDSSPTTRDDNPESHR